MRTQVGIGHEPQRLEAARARVEQGRRPAESRSQLRIALRISPFAGSF
jgi:hypothetical protein